MLFVRDCRSVFVCSLLAALMLFVACGDNRIPEVPDVPTDPDVDAEGCRVLTLGKPDFEFNFFGQLTGLRYPVTSNLEGAQADFLLIELYDSTTEGLAPLTPGTFDLTAIGDNNLATCQHCVWIKLDENADGSVESIYYQSKGALTLDEISDPLESIFAGGMSRVALHRSRVTPEGRSVRDPGNDCVSITNVRFDTTPTPGQACLSAEDCGNPLLEICDPASNVCAAPQCGDFISCPDAGQICVTQYRELLEGACYETCNPEGQSVSECAAGQRCVQFGPNPSSGVCRFTGDGAAGAACEREDNSTSCAGNALCSSETATCTSSCAFYDRDPGCPDGSVCNLFGVCEPPSTGSAVSLGEACNPEDTVATGCASDGDAFRGICFGFDSESVVCERACLGDRGCGTGEFCALRFESQLGICLPIPVCGDGVRGEINEACDDGNTVGGDGCSGDCQTVEVGVICGSQRPLAFDTDIQGDTASGRDGFSSTCQLGTARAELFEVTPPGPGRLRLHLVSPTAQTLSLRGDCADAKSEQACRGDFGHATEEEVIVQITSANPASLTAMVSAITVLDEGTFTLDAEFVAESCGDGVVAGNEICDDGNTGSNDGCRADCGEVEYNFFCAQAPLLSTTAPNTGDTTGAPHLFLSTCSSNDGLASGPDRLYRFVAPAAGNLHLQLFDAPNLLVATVLDGCGRPEEVTELACRQGFLGGELDVSLAAGQSTTIVVGGFAIDEQGPYSLEATFTPQ